MSDEDFVKALLFVIDAILTGMDSIDNQPFMDVLEVLDMICLGSDNASEGWISRVYSKLAKHCRDVYQLLIYLQKMLLDTETRTMNRTRAYKTERKENFRNTKVNK
jgi:hypothetical protein